MPLFISLPCLTAVLVRSSAAQAHGNDHDIVSEACQTMCMLFFAFMVYLSSACCSLNVVISVVCANDMSAFQPSWCCCECGCLSCGSRSIACAHREHAHACSHPCSMSRTVGVARRVVSPVHSFLAHTLSAVQLRPVSFRLHAHDVCTSACSCTCATFVCHTHMYSVCTCLRGCHCLHTGAVQHCCDLCAPMSLLYSTSGPLLIAMSHCSHLKHHLLHH